MEDIEYDNSPIITKTQVRELYRLSDEDMNNIPTYCAYGKIKCFYTSKVEKYCVEVLNIPDIEQYKFNIFEERRDKKKKSLIRELKKYDLEWDDSSLILHNYINEVEPDKKIKPCNVVDEYCKRKYLIEYCNLNKIIEEDTKDLDYYTAEELKNNSRVMSIYSDRALSFYSGGKYPDKYPWEKE